MQPIQYRVPGSFVLKSNGSVYATRPASQLWITRGETSHSNPLLGKSKYLPPMPYRFNAYESSLQLDYEMVSGSTKAEGNGSYLSSTIGTPVWDPPPDFRGTYSEALEKLNGRYRGDLDLSIDVAERHQVMKMFSATNRVESLTRVFNSLRKGKSFDRFVKTKFAASAWLEYTYGIKPLVSSIFGVADEIIRRRLNWLQTYRGRGTETFSPERVGFYTAEDQVAWIRNPGSLKISTTIGVNLTTSSFDLSRWTSLNPVSIAWELMPYSFVADWFLDVGGYLRNMETCLLNGKNFNSGYRTDLLVGDLRFMDVQTFTGTWTGKYLYQGTCRAVEINRYVLGSYPAPYLPSFKVKLGSSRLISAASLLAGFLGRR